ncbi:GTP pyrophosphokinase [Gemella bergeri]|nr:GTP pyrophosphokinase family protein [Gemella bergeri]
MKKSHIETLTEQLFPAENNGKNVLFNEIQPFIELFMHYECAMLEIETKLNVFDKEFSLHGENNPIESISTRLKSPVSLMNKLQRLNLDFDVNTIKQNIYDVAGVRVICSFKNDVYKLVAALKQQDDITVIAEKDYIKNNKDNGYRSYHLIVEIPIFLSGSVEHVAVEVQFRTIAMDFWASLEHKLRYKKNLSVEKEKEIERRLLLCAEISAKLDNQMQKVKEIIEEDEEVKFIDYNDIDTSKV